MSKDYNYTPINRQRLDWTELEKRIHLKGFNLKSFSRELGYNINWFHSNRSRDTLVKNRDIVTICMILECTEDDIIRKPEPEPEPELVVEEVPKVPEVVTSGNDEDFRQWIRDAYMQLHKDNLAIIEAIRTSSIDKVNMLVCLNNNTNQLCKLPGYSSSFYILRRMLWNIPKKTRCCFAKYPRIILSNVIGVKKSAINE